MKASSIVLFSAFILFVSCQQKEGDQSHQTPAPDSAQTQKIDTTEENPIEQILKTVPKDIKPVFGYRFVITGDFDGDGKREKLIEHFFSGNTNKETNKFFDGLTDYDQLVALTIKQNPFSFVLSDSRFIDTLFISSGSQLLGLSYLKNEGDLNGDGTDEVSYVINHADWSNLNTWHLATYQNKKWVDLYSFPIRDPMIPDLPQTFNQYGLFGLEQKIVNIKNDTINLRIEKELLEFKGLVRKIKKNKIQMIFVNDEADEDTMIVHLK